MRGVVLPALCMATAAILVAGAGAALEMAGILRLGHLASLFGLLALWPAFEAAHRARQRGREIRALEQARAAILRVAAHDFMRASTLFLGRSLQNSQARAVAALRLPPPPPPAAASGRSLPTLCVTPRLLAQRPLAACALRAG